MTHLEELASALDQLTEPMKTALVGVAFGNEDHEAGVGTWFKLRKLGLLGENFKLTQLGIEAAHVIR